MARIPNSTVGRTGLPAALRLLYNLLFLLCLPLVCGYYLLASVIKSRRIYRVKERFGRYRPRATDAWHIHGVSLGEVMLALRLGQELERATGIPVVYTTTTDTGFQYLLAHCPAAQVHAFPLDNVLFAGAFFRRLKPMACIMMETEIWPEFISQAQRRGVPLFLANARLSQRSLPRYRRLGFLFRPLLNAFAGIYTQTEQEKDKFLAFADPDRVQVTGNLKYDLMDSPDSNKLDALKQQLDLPADSLVLVAGSTFAAEEQAICSAFGRLKASFPRLRLVLAPRHAHRFDEVHQYVRGLGFTVTRRKQESGPRDWDIMLLDTIGELRYVYALADVAFVGGSLIPLGGHNILEPAFWGRPVLTGPYYFNFKEIMADFVAARAVCVVSGADTLHPALADLLASADRRLELGQRARQCFLKGRGAAGRTAAAIGQSCGTV